MLPISRDTRHYFFWLLLTARADWILAAGLEACTSTMFRTILIVFLPRVVGQ